MYFLVIKTGSKEGRKGTQSGERNEQGNNPKTPICSVFQGMLKGFVWGVLGVLGWWFFGSFLVGSVSVFCLFRLQRFYFFAHFSFVLITYFLRPFFTACRESDFIFAPFFLFASRWSGRFLLVRLPP
jgi:hypothetical protein